MKTSQLYDFQIYPLSDSQLKFFDKVARKLSYSIGVCPVCGSVTIFSRFTDNLRESGMCVVCKSTNRQRQIAFAMLKAIQEKTGIYFPNVKKFASTASNYEAVSEIKIYNTESSGCLNSYLKNYSGYLSSEYMGENYISGQTVNGVIHQDLMNTSFPDNSFDIILSSDVFEHIPNPYDAFKEVYRILKPGGRHIFTVPFYQTAYRDEVRAIIDSNGNLQNLLPPIFHHDPIRPEGILVYVIFSLEMLVKLNEIGYNVRMYNLRNIKNGILGNNAIVFDSLKP